MVGGSISLEEQQLTAHELSIAQSEHYMLDDELRRLCGTMTADGKRKVIDFARKTAGGGA